MLHRNSSKECCSFYLCEYVSRGMIAGESERLAAALDRCFTESGIS